MKKTIVLICCLALSANAISQSRTDMKGPNAKNYKPWKHEAKATPVESKTAGAVEVKGPRAKNKKAWRKGTEGYADVSVDTNRTKTLKGPKAKNAKPWKRDDSN